MIFEAKAQPIRAGAGSPVTRVLVGIGVYNLLAKPESGMKGERA